jgi:hypothetical protein
VKHLAAQIDATPLADFLKGLEGASPEKSLLVLYTGNTQAHLEPCGCFIGQSGGLPRRATAVSLIRKQGFSPLLVDLGNLLPSEGSKMKSGAQEEIVLSELKNAAQVGRGFCPPLRGIQINKKQFIIQN